LRTIPSEVLQRRVEFLNFFDYCPAHYGSTKEENYPRSPRPPTFFQCIPAPPGANLHLQSLQCSRAIPPHLRGLRPLQWQASDGRERNRRSLKIEARFFSPCPDCFCLTQIADFSQHSKPGEEGKQSFPAPVFFVLMFHHCAKFRPIPNGSRSFVLCCVRRGDRSPNLENKAPGEPKPIKNGILRAKESGKTQNSSAKPRPSIFKFPLRRLDPGRWN
jgi:hypothetical protein